MSIAGIEEFFDYLKESEKQNKLKEIHEQLDQIVESSTEELLLINEKYWELLAQLEKIEK